MIFTTIFFTFFISNLTKAQPRTGEFIDASIGFGYSFPFDDIDISGSGFYLQGEYVYALTKWFGVRPYAGLVLTSADDDQNLPNQPEYKVTANAFLLGGKIRLVAPIPWFAPYTEVGIGASIGSFETFTPFTNIKENGLQWHIPFTLGVALGPRHNFDFAVSYYFHPSIEQFAGGVGLGLSFPLN
ncbi:hypothetical protein J8M14_18660 [Aquimarina sp. MMG016]|nr:hypothetical protein [Aquimarina sp. MMG016]